MSRPAGDRHASIDLLRAMAIVLMVVVHFVENLSGWYDGGQGPFEGVHRVWWLPTGFAAPLFTSLSGMSYRLWADEQARRGHSGDTISKRTVRRGLFLIGLGFAFNVLVWLPEDVFNWDVLTLIGCGLLALDLARRMPDTVVLMTTPPTGSPGISTLTSRLATCCSAGLWSGTFRSSRGWRFLSSATPWQTSFSMQKPERGRRELLCSVQRASSSHSR